MTPIVTGGQPQQLPKPSSNLAESAGKYRYLDTGTHLLGSKPPWKVRDQKKKGLTR